jgi:hypothetical protein
VSLRKDLADTIRSDWASVPTLADFRVIATERELDDIQVPTALIRQRTIVRTPGLPLSHRDVGMILTLISPHTDLDRAADQLDEPVLAALDYLDQYQHEGATQVGYLDRLAYDLPFTVITAKE